MALLKKIKGSTLMETMVATVLIVVLFLMASMLLNSIFASTIKDDTQNVSARISELEYQYQHGLIALPHYETYNDWEISFEIENMEHEESPRVKAIHSQTKKEIKTNMGVDEKI
ncbi:MAG: hypothetical protein ABJN95_05595 [Maribacter sp.]|uniref:PulJ/GspJ family protein n=1 Tax=Maribacter sp. TaxID=1897614 RepID=UPI0032997828